ncbi:MAG: DUF2809 domain-containing protein [Bacteroidota bacterium]
MKLTFSLRYLMLAVLLFVTEVLIAAYLHDAVIRPYGGDFLVVILLYCFVKSFIDTPVMITAIGVLIFSYMIEVSQYFHFVDVIGLGESKLAVVILGNYFAWTDLLAYTLGIATLMLLEQMRIKRSIEKVYQQAIND